MMYESLHIPVLLRESVDYMLKSRTTGIYIDATLGGGGTTEYILKQLDSSGRVIGIDRDAAAIEISNLKLKPYPNFKAVRENYRALESILEDEEIESIDGIIFDLGVSSMQLDEADRGFSFRLDARLDMRMDQENTTITAYELINKLDERELREFFRKYGEDRWAGRVASRIVEHRKKKKIETTAELAELIFQSIPRKLHPKRIHPATRFFQALRIAVNEELESLKEGLEAAVRLLKPEGRIVVISYHSLEDRIVKNIIREQAAEGILKRITKKPVVPSGEETEKNPRARSAKMRVAEKIKNR
jgi:16S rRNA (cytosine1402-N4)-methyltransferase